MIKVAQNKHTTLFIPECLTLDGMCAKADDTGWVSLGFIHSDTGIILDAESWAAFAKFVQEVSDDLKGTT